MLKRRTLPLVAAAAAAVALIAGWLLLPRVDSRAGRAPGEPATDTLLLTLPPGARVLYRHALDEVAVGDTILSFRYARYAKQRDSLLRFASIQQSPPAAAGLPGEIGTAYREILSYYEASARAAAPDTFLAPAVSAEERELLEADLAGAEDASTELMTKLTELESAGTLADAADATRLRRELEDKQRTIRGLRRQIDDHSAVVRTRTQGARRPRLTQEQRIRIAALARALPHDTAYALAERAGRYLPIARAPAGAIVAERQIGEGALYGLEREGGAGLWARARRLPIDSVADDGERATELLYVVRSD